jgi:hypothetical protein
MPDAIIPLFDLSLFAAVQPLKAAPEVVLRRALPPERPVLRRWVGERFSQSWDGEVDVALSRTPPTCVIALHGTDVVGFLCFEVTFRGFIGPGGVAQSHRRKGIFEALFRRTCLAMHELGYAYAIVGDVAEETLGLVRKLGGTSVPLVGRSPYTGMLPIAST